MSEIYIAHVGAPSEEEIRKYKEMKEKEYQESFTNSDKMTRKKVIAFTSVGNIRAALCPVCNHCVLYPDSFCDECYQRLDWNLTKDDLERID